MLPINSSMPSAGRIVPVTFPAVRCTTVVARMVIVNTLTSRLMNKPEKALSSLGRHQGIFAGPSPRNDVFMLPSDMSRSPASSDDARFDSSAGQRRQQLRRMRHPTEDSALRADHLQGHTVKLGKVGSDAVFEHEAFEAAVVGLADRGMDAHLGRDPGDDQAVDASVAEYVLEIGRVEAALARLVQHDFSHVRAELVDNVVAPLPPYEHSPLWAEAADAEVQPASCELRRRAVRKVGPVSLARVYDEHAGVPSCREHLTHGLDYAPQQGDVVAQ